MTGDIHKGFPVGRISTLFGLSQSGKSLIAANTVVNALKNDQVDVVYIFDSEGGTLVDFFKKAGVDLEKINHIPVASIEQCSVKMLQVYDELVKARQEYLDDPDNNDNIRALCVLDSYGALAADKLVNDAVNKDRTAMDMGLGAKLKNNMMRGLMMRVVQSNATLLVINHAFQDPSAMFASKIQNIAGGKGIEFASHVILQCEKVFVKSTDTEFLTGFESDNDEVGFYKGNKLKFFTGMFNALQRDGVVETNPWLSVKRYPKDNHTRRELTAGEVGRILSVAATMGGEWHSLIMVGLLAIICMLGPRNIHRASARRLLHAGLEGHRPRAHDCAGHTQEDQEVRLRPARHDTHTPAAPRRAGAHPARREARVCPRRDGRLVPAAQVAAHEQDKRDVHDPILCVRSCRRQLCGAELRCRTA